MLSQDDRKKRCLQRIGLALDRPKPIFPACRIVGSESDEALFSQPGRESLVGFIVRPLRRDYIEGKAIVPVLTHHHGPLLSRSQVLWDTEYPPDVNIRPDVENHFVACPRLFFTYLS